jgi:hypothetical protein
MLDFSVLKMYFGSTGYEWQYAQRELSFFEGKTLEPHNGGEKSQAVSLVGRYPKL